MKTNKMMRLASVLLVAVLLSTCAISGTFAKYVTTGSANDSARVAKFGVTVAGSGDNAFETTYDTDDGIYSGVITKSVIGVGGEKVVAPGTKGEFANVNLYGQPEVAVKVSYDATVTLNDKWLAVSTAFYCPIIVTVKGTSYLKTINGLDYDNASDFAEKIKEEIQGYTQVYDPNTNLVGVNADELVVSWEWPFEGSTGSKINQSDVDDTLLGDRAAHSDADAGRIEISVSATVTQID
ncbi:MAG: hypothetical protein J6C26_08780 [Clostridia bacterium]|nr:hypothetical protein [Clostridia bacterium]